MAALGAFAVALQPEDGSGAARKRLFALVIFLGAALGVVGGIAMRAHESELRVQFESDLRTRTEEILSTVTGGDGYCTITFLRPFTDRSRVLVANRGATPLYDVTVRIVDLDRMPESNATGVVGFDDFFGSQSLLDIGNMPADAALFLTEPWDFSGDTRRRYKMFFSARNGSWTQSMDLLRENGNWTYTMQIVRGDSVLYEHTDKTYAEVLGKYGEPNGAP